MKQLAEQILKSERILLSTHKQCDGDGLGAELALFFALKKLGKDVRVLNVDRPPRKYDFLNCEKILQCFDSAHDPIAPSDLALIFDTNDRRLLDPLYPELEKKCKKILFVDHHPLIEELRDNNQHSYIDPQAASTGELAFELIQELNIPLDNQIAEAIYVSIVFDTQLFKFIRNSANSHRIAAELLTYSFSPELVHRHLFENYTVEKIKFLATVLNKIEYYHENQVALVKIKATDLTRHQLMADETRDIIDTLMNIESVELAALFREDGENLYKLSLRSKGRVPISRIAEFYGGGGHLFAAGVTLNGDYEEHKKEIIQKLNEVLDQSFSDNSKKG